MRTLGIRICACAIVAALVASCVPAPLVGKGELGLWNSRDEPALRRAAAAFPDLRLREMPRDGKDLSAALAAESPPDLFYVDWNAESAQAAAAGKFAELRPWRARLAANKILLKPLREGYFGPEGAGRHFLPSSLYVWGLFHDKKTLEGLGIAEPADLAALEAAFEIAAAKGITPLALGSSFGWPLLGLVSILDLRMNGAAAHEKLLAGERSFDDPSLVAVYARLASWRDRGWLSKDAATTSWTESLQAVAEGKALFTYLPATAFSRAPAGEGIGFLAFPPRTTKDARAELAAVRGFLVSASAGNLSAAFALADAYVASGSPGAADDQFSLPASLTQPSESPLDARKKTEKAVVDGATALLPQLDWALPAQASYDARRAAVDFLKPGDMMGAEAFARALKAAASR